MAVRKDLVWPVGCSVKKDWRCYSRHLGHQRGCYWECCLCCYHSPRRRRCRMGMLMGPSFHRRRGWALHRAATFAQNHHPVKAVLVGQTRARQMDLASAREQMSGRTQSLELDQGPMAARSHPLRLERRVARSRRPRLLLLEQRAAQTD